MIDKILLTITITTMVVAAVRDHDARDRTEVMIALRRDILL